MRLAPYLGNRAYRRWYSDLSVASSEVHEGTLLFQEITAFPVRYHRGYWG